ncbi:MAG: alpha-amylase [Bacteroidales bacterium]|nr:alpha-amylase [Bacteroidales bacterium]
MRKTICLLSALLLLVACGEKGKEQPETKTLNLTVSPSSLSYSAVDESHKLINVSTTGSWTATPAGNWIHLDKNSGNGSSSVTVTVDENDTDMGRSANILFISSLSGQEKQASVQVSQNGNGKKPVTPNPAKFDGNKRASTTYQLLVYSFADGDGKDGIGDFKGIKENLDYLDGLGVTALWLSPAHPTNSYHGYDVNDYNALNPLFGTEADFKELIDAAHEKGIKIYMDYVLNHSGTGTEWFKSVKADPKNSPYRDYYVLSNGDYPTEAVGGMGGWVSLGDGNIGYKGRLHFKVTMSNGKPSTVTVNKSTAAVTGDVSGAKVWIYAENPGKCIPMKEVDGAYEVVADIDTPWGFLVRTSTSSWDNGTKYGGKTNKNVITFGQPLALDSSTAADIVFGETTSYYASFDGSMPDLNYGKPDECENSRAFKSTVESAIKWVNLGVDGFRLDAVVWVYAASATANIKFLSKWYDAVNEAYKAAGHSDDIFMVGEAWNGGHAEEQKYYGGLPSNFEFDFWRHALQPAVNNAQGAAYASKVIGYITDHEKSRKDASTAITSFFMTNHDKSSIKSIQNPYNDKEWLSFYRAADDLNKDIVKERQACAMLLTTPGKPFIYQGEELGYWRGLDDKNHLDDEYIRAPIVWDAAGSKVAKKGVNNKVDNDMLKGSISVETQSTDENSLLNTYKTWGQLRNTYPALAEGEMSTTSISDNSIASWYMTAGSQKLLVIHNVGNNERTLKLSDNISNPIALLGTAFITDEGLVLSAHSSVIFEL